MNVYQQILYNLIWWGCWEWLANNRDHPNNWDAGGLLLKLPVAPGIT